MTQTETLTRPKRQNVIQQEIHTHDYIPYRTKSRVAVPNWCHVCGQVKVNN